MGTVTDKTIIKDYAALVVVGVGATVVGFTVVGTTVVGLTVVGATVVGATVVGFTVSWVRLWLGLR